uniref:tRNA:m(4)X modification enzyme TRM13 n=1 Tax=Hippocampus comes TaxID=109280 RepID=A0A3Q2ZAZ2_HIPCM
MAAPATDRNGKCAFFVEKKKRFCKMVVAKGREFCGEHANNEEGGGGGGGRIVCPLDPKHTVNRNKLEAHLKKCNSRDKAKPAYYAEDINAGSPVPSQHSLQQVTPASLSSWSARASRRLGNPLRRQVTLCERSAEADNPKNGDSARKHLKQQASILGHLEALGLLRRGRCFVEFGAGRGKLSHWIHRALEGHPPERLQMLLVERSSTRFKVDGKHRGGDVEFARLHIDIQHLDLTKVPLLERRLPLVGVGKHLCGAATDLALRCLFRSRPTPGREAGRPPKRLKAEAAHPGGVAGLALALCCHHRCEWRHYVGRRFFSDLGLGPAEFSAFCRMSSWATCGVRAAPRAAGAEEASDGGLPSPSERERIGRRCKLLLDAGRVEFLRAEGFDARLTRYVGAGVTPENVLLTAAPRPPSPET